jgi:hypothetical protein
MLQRRIAPFSRRRLFLPPLAPVTMKPTRRACVRLDAFLVLAAGCARDSARTSPCSTGQRIGLGTCADDHSEIFRETFPGTAYPSTDPPRPIAALSAGGYPGAGDSTPASGAWDQVGRDLEMRPGQSLLSAFLPGMCRERNLDDPARGPRRASALTSPSVVSPAGYNRNGEDTQYSD